MLDKVLTSSLAKSFAKWAKSGRLKGKWNSDPLQIDCEKVIFNLWNEQFFDDQDESSSYALALLSIVWHQSFSAACDLDVVFDQCGSPIEKMFLSALICACNNKEVGIALYTEERRPCFEDLPVDTDSYLHIYPQEQIGNYRVDFMLALVLDNHLVSIDDEGCTCVSGQAKLVVECDGHDYHERTREQASRDKERDRTLQSCGYNVFRFTGSDVYQDAFKCVMESLDHLFDKILNEAMNMPAEEQDG